MAVTNLSKAPLCRKTSASRPADPRGVCNLILDEAKDSLTNLSLQRLLYLAYGIFLTRTGRPLTYGYFEAWRHGPVHPAAHEAFCTAGQRPINFRAVRQDPFTYQITAVSPPEDEAVVATVKDVIRFYGHLSSKHLVDLCAAQNTPWSAIVDKARTGVVLGMVIPDELILERFKYHKILVGMEPKGRCPREDAPYP